MDSNITSKSVLLVSKNLELFKAIKRLSYINIDCIGIVQDVSGNLSNSNVILIADTDDIDWCLMGIRNNCCNPIILLGIRPDNFNASGMQYLPIPFLIKELRDSIVKSNAISGEKRKKYYFKSLCLNKIKAFTTHDLYNEVGRGNKDGAINMYLKIRNRIPADFTEAHQKIDEAIKKVKGFTEPKQFIEFGKYKNASDYRIFLDYLSLEMRQENEGK